MSATKSFLSSTIGRKQLVGVTGLALSLFVLTHMAGNLLIFKSPYAYNSYAHALITNPLLIPAEIGLLVMFVMHLGLALKLSLENHFARPQKYAKSASGDKATSLVTKTMWHQGIVLLVFVIYHLITFKYGPNYTVTYSGEEMRDLHSLVLEVFQSPGYVAWYCVALVVLGFHLSHGVSSAIRSLGFHHPRHTSLIEKIGVAYGIVIALGFISQPIYVFFFAGGSHGTF